jgi:hypothetical protein
LFLLFAPEVQYKHIIYLEYQLRFIKQHDSGFNIPLFKGFSVRT